MRLGAVGTGVHRASNILRQPNLPCAWVIDIGSVSIVARFRRPRNLPSVCHNRSRQAMRARTSRHCNAVPSGLDRARSADRTPGTIRSAANEPPRHCRASSVGRDRSSSASPARVRRWCHVGLGGRGSSGRRFGGSSFARIAFSGASRGDSGKRLSSIVRRRSRARADFVVGKVERHDVVIWCRDARPSRPHKPAPAPVQEHGRT
jgi:hypothetical protein